MGILGRLVQEDVLHDDALHRPQPGGHVLGVGVGLRDVLTLDIQRLEAALHRGVQHVWDAPARVCGQRHAPGSLEHLPRRIVGNVAVAGQLVREAAHVTGALNVVLPPERVQTGARTPNLPGDQGERDQATRVVGAVDVLTDTHTPEDD